MKTRGTLPLLLEKVTPETINFMLTHARGILCLSINPERAEALDLYPMVSHNTSNFQTPFTVSIDARDGITTGVSSKDRAATILTTIDDKTKPEDLVRPGHIFPLKAQRRCAGQDRTHRRCSRPGTQLRDSNLPQLSVRL